MIGHANQFNVTVYCVALELQKLALSSELNQIRREADEEKQRLRHEFWSDLKRIKQHMDFEVDRIRQVCLT